MILITVSHPVPVPEDDDGIEDGSINNESFKDQIIEELKAILPAFENDGKDTEVLKTFKFIFTLMKRRRNLSKSAFIKLMYGFTNKRPSNNFGSKILVQATAPNRRKKNFGRGRSAAQPGRPRLAINQQLAHSISKAIKDNRHNAKKKSRSYK